MTRLMQQMAPLLRRLLQDDLAAEVRRQQLNLLALTAALFSVVGSSGAVLLAIYFRASLTVLSGLSCALIPLLYGALLWATRRWRADGLDHVFLRRGALLLAALGATWGLLINLLAPSALPNQQGVIDALVIALISTPLAVAPITAALAFWLPGALSGMLIVCFNNTGFDPFLVLCYLVYASFTLSAVLQLNRFMLDRSISQVILEKQNQTIAMFLQDYTENASDWLWETDQRLGLRHVSPRFADVAGKTQAELEGVPILSLLLTGADEAAADLDRSFSERAAFRNVVVPVSVGGEIRWWSITGRPVMGEGALFEGYRGIGSDVSDVRRSEQRVKFLALHDSLTGLANRQSFMDSLHEACVLKRNGRGNTDPVAALLLLDLDRFKDINDGFGHAAGDALLEAVGGRLRACLRGDSVVARLGGDEFGVLITASNEAAVFSVCQRVIDTLNVEYALAGSRHGIGVSIGVSFLDPDHAMPAHWLRCADLALYAAKAAGRGVWRLFRDEMITKEDDRLNLREDLRTAIGDGSLRLVYQPIFDVNSGAIVCVEALSRWEHAVHGAIPPSRFIRLAEETGMIGQLGVWALTEACRAAASWPAEVRIAVNVSPLQLRDGNFQAVVAHALAETGLAADRLELELTEYAYLDANERTLQSLQILRRAGVRIVLDDFGTGYSSLSYVASFQCDGVKIESSFIHDIETHVSKAAVVRAIGQLAAELQIPVTAEGVETAEQLEAVRGFAVTCAQGYFLQRPASEAVVRALLEGQAMPGISQPEAANAR
ncbi:putative bifunctional diguanylate cyclase/phosphodiesterase [Lichenicoccus sp.]|uniref:putative bifunctional diguanylate cyclase/phosphodiesterase n=1 Tax=Lichenicoccus sp. TaxID=2781899 RepID=UPI003D106350